MVTVTVHTANGDDRIETPNVNDVTTLIRDWLTYPRHTLVPRAARYPGDIEQITITR